MSTLLAPNLTPISQYGRDRYSQFFENTDPNNIQRYAQGSNLTELADLAESVKNIINHCRFEMPNADQWELDHLSAVKERLSRAIDMKRNYYDNHLFGIITKYVLMLFGKWNNGDTASIVAAEDFLLFWDSRKPVGKISHPDNSSYGKYFSRLDFNPSTRGLDTSHYFNYNPRRLIEMQMGEQINYATLNNFNGA